MCAFLSQFGDKTIPSTELNLTTSSNEQNGLLSIDGKYFSLKNVKKLNKIKKNNKNNTCPHSDKRVFEILCILHACTGHMHDYVLTLLRLLCTEELQDEEEEEQEEGSVACANAIAKATANNE